MNTINKQCLPARAELSILFTSDRTLRSLNKAYRGLDKTTDVLSFSESEGEADFVADSLGDVVISVDRAKIQAKRFKVSVPEELLRLLIHGILHLFGFDHVGVSKKKVQAMRKLENDLFSRHCVAAKTMLNS